MNSRAPMLLIAGLLFASTFVGCGSKGNLERAVLSGKVTLAGKPVADGTVRLKSIGSAPRPISVGIIKEGKYIIDVRGGVPVGEHRVMIEAIRPIPGADPIPVPEMGTMAIPTEQYIPEKYNKQSELQVSIEPGSGQVTHDFDLEP